MRKLTTLFISFMMALSVFAITPVETDTKDVYKDWFFEVDTTIYYEDYQPEPYMQELGQEALQKVKELFGVISPETIKKYVDSLKQKTEDK